MVHRCAPPADILSVVCGVFTSGQSPVRTVWMCATLGQVRPTLLTNCCASQWQTLWPCCVLQIKRCTQGRLLMAEHVIQPTPSSPHSPSITALCVACCAPQEQSKPKALADGVEALIGVTFVAGCRTGAKAVRTMVHCTLHCRHVAAVAVVCALPAFNACLVNTCLASSQHQLILIGALHPCGPVGESTIWLLHLKRLSCACPLLKACCYPLQLMQSLPPLCLATCSHPANRKHQQLHYQCTWCTRRAHPTPSGRLCKTSRPCTAASTQRLCCARSWGSCRPAAARWWQR